MKRVQEKVSVIIPVYNQEKTIKNDIVNLKRKLNYIGLNKDFELIIVDDGSTDETYWAIDELRGGVADYALTKHENEGKGAAFKDGFKYAWGDYIMLIDSDAQIDCEDLHTFFNIMSLYRADVVIGNKRHLYSQVKYSPIRWIVSNTYNFVCRVLFGIRLRDTQCGFKLFKKKALTKIMPRLLVKRFAFDLELIVALRANNFRVADAPVCVSEQQGSGSVSIRNIIDTARDTLAVWYRKQKGWYKRG